MLSTIGEKLTHATGGRLDFFNIGGLLKQRAKGSLIDLWNHYSWRELLVRGGIVTTTVVMSVFSANTCNTEECSPVIRGIVGGTLGLFAAHTVAVLPTIHRRNKIIQETKSSYNHIEYLLSELDRKSSLESTHHLELLRLITSVKKVALDHLNLKLPVQKKGDAVLNLITVRKRVLAIEAEIINLADELESSSTEDKARLIQNAQSFWNNPHFADNELTERCSASIKM